MFTFLKIVTIHKKAYLDSLFLLHKYKYLAYIFDVSTYL